MQYAKIVVFNLEINQTEDAKEVEIISTVRI